MKEQRPADRRPPRPSWGRSLRRSALLVGAVALAAGACTQSVRLLRFLEPTAPSLQVVHAFGQLIDDAGTLTAAHSIALDLEPNATPVRTPSTGVIRFLADLNGLPNCLVLMPRWVSSDATPFEGLDQTLPKPRALRLAFCNLLNDANELRSAMAALFSAQPDFTGDPTIAANSFLAGNPNFDELPVTADYTNYAASSRLGEAKNGLLHLAAYTWEDEDDDRSEEATERTFVNPAPYLDAILPAGQMDAQPPEIAAIALETSTNIDFAAPALFTFNLADGSVSPPTPASGHLRFWFRLETRDSTVADGPTVVPYEIAYKLSRVTRSGAGITDRDLRSAGTFHLNRTPSGADAEAAASILYNQALSDVAAHGYWLYLPLDSTFPAVDPPTVKDALDLTPVDTSTDSEAVVGGDRVLPVGEYELDLAVRDAFSAPSAADRHQVYFHIGASYTVTVTSIEGIGPTPDRVYQEKPLPFAPRRMYVGNSGTIAAPVADPPMVIVTAQVFPPAAVTRLYWSWLDPDEPAGAAPDDSDGAEGDNHGAAPAFSAEGAFSYDPGTTSSVPDAAGIVKVRFTASTWGGDNFRLGVGADAGASNADRYVRRITQTEILTVWKRIYLEGPFQIASTFALGADVWATTDGLLTQVYVEREMTAAPGAIDHTNAAVSAHFTDAGRYGPTSAAGRIAVADLVDDGNGDTAVLGVVGAHNAARDLIDPGGANHRPAPLDTAILADYDFVAVGDATDDVDEAEHDLGNVTGYSQTADPVNPYTFLYVDTMALNAAFTPAFTPEDRVARSLVHEIGHHLGLDGYPEVHDAVGNHIMSSLPAMAGGAADIATFGDKISMMHWHNTNAERIRELYVPKKR